MKYNNIHNRMVRLLYYDDIQWYSLYFDLLDQY
jgi:hypothetical protein